MTAIDTRTAGNTPATCKFTKEQILEAKAILNSSKTLIGRAKSVQNAVARFFAVVGVLALYITIIPAIVDCVRAASLKDALKHLEEAREEIPTKTIDNRIKYTLAALGVVAVFATIYAIASYASSGQVEAPIRDATNTLSSELEIPCAADPLADLAARTAVPVGAATSTLSSKLEIPCAADPLADLAARTAAPLELAAPSFKSSVIGNPTLCQLNPSACQMVKSVATTFRPTSPQLEEVLDPAFPFHQVNISSLPSPLELAASSSKSSVIGNPTLCQWNPSACQMVKSVATTLRPAFPFHQVNISSLPSGNATLTTDTGSFPADFNQAIPPKATQITSPLGAGTFTLPKLTRSTTVQGNATLAADTGICPAPYNQTVAITTAQTVHQIVRPALETPPTQEKARSSNEFTFTGDALSDFSLGFTGLSLAVITPLALLILACSRCGSSDAAAPAAPPAPVREPHRLMTQALPLAGKATSGRISDEEADAFIAAYNQAARTNELTADEESMLKGVCEQIFIATGKRTEKAEQRLASAERALPFVNALASRIFTHPNVKEFLRERSNGTNQTQSLSFFRIRPEESRVQKTLQAIRRARDNAHALERVSLYRKSSDVLCNSFKRILAEKFAGVKNLTPGDIPLLSAVIMKIISMQPNNGNFSLESIYRGAPVITQMGKQLEQDMNRLEAKFRNHRSEDTKHLYNRCVPTLANGRLNQVDLIKALFFSPALPEGVRHSAPVSTHNLLMDELNEHREEYPTLAAMRRALDDSHHELYEIFEEPLGGGVIKR